MMHSRRRLLAALGVAALTGSAMAQVGSGGTINAGGVTFTQADSPTSPTDADGACCAGVLNAGGGDQLYQNGWWYRINGVDTRELSFANATSWSWAGDTGTLTYTLPEFTAVATWIVSEPAPGQGRVTATLSVQNTGAAPLDISVFNYIDMDLTGPGVDAGFAEGPNALRVEDGPVAGYFRATNPTNYQVGAFATLRTLLTDADIDDLNNSGNPFSGDWTAAYQWNTVIPAGQTVVFTTVFGTEPSLPVGVCCTGAACSVSNQPVCAGGGGTWTATGTCPSVTYTESSTCGGFENIAATGTLSTVDTCDDCGQLDVPIGFTFNYFGQSYTDLDIASNGYVHFGTQSAADLGNDPIPSATDPDNIIAGNWDDLNPATAGTVHYQTLGTAPNQRFIVQWTDVARFGAATLTHTFQIVLFEGTNEIQLRYVSLPPLSGTITPSLGLENADGSIGYSINQPDVAGGGCRSYLPQAAGANPCSNTCTADFNNSGGVSVQDIYDFLTDWNSQVNGGPVIIASANFNSVGGVTVQDLYDYFSAWNTQVADPSCN